MMRLIYLASPYNDPSEKVREDRYLAAMKAAAFFAKEVKGVLVYSPICSWHLASTKYNLPKNFDYWFERDLFMIKKSSAVWVLALESWQDSYGIQQEMEYARDIGRDILFVSGDKDLYHLTDKQPTRTIPIG